MNDKVEILHRGQSDPALLKRVERKAEEVQLKITLKQTILKELSFPAAFARKLSGLEIL